MRLAFLLMLTGAVIYLCCTIVGISVTDYQHFVTPSLVEHPLKNKVKINETYDMFDAFHNIYYDPYDLYI